MSAARLDRIAPPLFVLIWSTGWISAGYAAKTSDPLTFLAIRFALAGLALIAIALIARAPWPSRPRDWIAAMISGVLLHAIYLGGVWWAIRQGLPASVSGLLAALQPILTAALAPILIGERITRRQWLGVAVGVAGVALVLEPRLSNVSSEALRAALGPILVNVVGMVAVTLGAFFQKRFVAAGDLRTTTVAQYVGAFVVTLPVAMAIEPMRIGLDLTTALTMLWSVFALSIGAIGLLLALIRRGAVARAAALIYLIPPTVALEAWALFGERLAPLQIAGMGLAALGMAWTTPRRAGA
jgi:drug/metabolite transporter (DMT)-like permease